MTPKIPLILIPGLAADATLWQGQIDGLGPLLEDRHPVRVTDVIARFETHAEMASALLAEHPGPLILAGSSMGGIVAMEVMRQAPERIVAWALLGTTARADTPEMKVIREAAFALIRNGQFEKVILDNVPVSFHESRLHDQPLIDVLLGFLRRSGPDQLISQNIATMARPDSRPMLASVTCPTLVMCGDSDRVTPPELSREIASLVAHSQLEFVKDCGHLLTMERPAEVNAVLLQWLNSIDLTVT
ncbi:MAG: alpha/beta hydrolase family protein [Rhizobacter sp.]|nr:alpha/beta hydrolase family protein [Rhizobacter sp.]